MAGPCHKGGIILTQAMPHKRELKKKVHIFPKSVIVNMLKNIQRRKNVNQNNNSANSPGKQDISEYWTEKIKTMLPRDLEESAKREGALLRKRGVKSAYDLLKLMLIYAVSTMSMRMLSLSASSLKLADISDTAIRKRFVKSVAWLTYLLNSLLPKPIIQKEKQQELKKTVHIIDSSNVVEAGKSGRVLKIHMSYNLNIASMDEVKITDKHTAESFAHYTIQKGHIYLADSGYGKAQLYDYIIKRGGDALLRLTPNHIKLIEVNGQAIDMTKKLEKSKKIIDFECYTLNGKKKLPVRIIASQLPEDKKANAIKRKKRSASKRQTKQMKPETLIYAEWVIIMTSLDESYSAEKVLEIYRSRWQIELLFKRIKQHFKVTKIRPSSQKYGEALVLLWLIIWAMVERQVYQAEIHLIEKGNDMNRFSPWLYCSYFFHRLKTMIESLWATILDPIADIEKIAAKLENHKQSRINQYFEYHLNNFLEQNNCYDDNIRKAA